MDGLEVLQIQQLKGSNSIPESGREELTIEKLLSIDSKAKKDCFEHVETVVGTRCLLKCFRIVGVYMPQSNKVLYICWSVFINMLVTVYSPIGFAMSYVTMSEEELVISNILTSLQAGINVSCCSVKILVMAFLLPQLLSCEPILKKLDQRCCTQEEFNKIKILIKKSNLCAVMFAVCYFVYTSITCLTSVLTHHMPYNIYNPFIDAKSSNLNFFLSILMEIPLIYVICFQQTAADAYPVIYVSFLRTHLDILMKRISKLNTNTQQSLQENIEELKMCIIDHKNLIELYKRVGAVISKTIFVQFTITAVVMSATLINILLFAVDFGSTVASCLYILAVLIEVFPLCYYAQCLMDESNRLPDVIFHSNWVDQSHSYRKTLVFFMQRAQCSFEFTAGKFFPITLNTFLKVAKFTFSLYTFVKEMGIKEKFA